MNILYLLKALKTNKLSELTAVIEAAPLDMNLALWDAVNKGDIEINEDKDRVTALKEADRWKDRELGDKLLRAIKQYADNETNITRGRLQSYIKDPASGRGYPLHEYLMTLQYLIDNGDVIEEIVTVPKTKKRPYRKYAFLCLPGNPNEEWNAAAVNKWIANFESTK